MLRRQLYPQIITQMSAGQFLGNRKCRVLAVDDDDLVLTLIARFLKQASYEVFTCCDGPSALKCLNTYSFDVLLLDIRMPGMTGLELFSIAQKRWPELTHKTGFVTGDVPSSETRAFLRQTDRPVLFKPFSIEALESFVRNLAQPIVPPTTPPQLAD